jgi:choice-of-anchor C domain-containing protein
MKILGLVAGAALLLGAHGAYAAPVTIANGSFEAPDLNGNSLATYGPGGSLTDWTIGGDSIDLIGSYWKALDGDQSVDLNGNGVGEISQTVSNLLQGQEYTVSFYYAATPGYVPQTIDVSFGTSLKSLTLNSAGTTDSMNWTLGTISFIADSTGSALLKFAGTSNLINNHAGMALDNVTIAATPIPGAILLFGSALGGLGFLGHRRKKQAVEA